MCKGACLNHLRAPLLKLLLKQEWLERSIQRFLNVLEQDPSSKADAVLESPQEVLVRELDHVDPVEGKARVLAHVLDVAICLPLRETMGQGYTDDVQNRQRKNLFSTFTIRVHNIKKALSVSFAASMSIKEKLGSLLMF